MDRYLADVTEFMKRERDAIQLAIDSVDPAVSKVINRIIDAKAVNGRVIFSGVGKTGHIGSKLAATFASLGTPSFFVHSVEAMHGDMGMITKDDVVILISNSGETKETIAVLPSIRSIGATIVSITRSADSTLAKGSDLPIVLPVNGEADDLGLAPSNSSTEVLVLGDAIGLTLARVAGFSKKDFAKFHPGGALGRALLGGEEI